MFILDHREIYADGKYVALSKFASNRQVGQYQTIVSINVRTRPNLPPTGHHRNASPLRRETAKSSPPERMLPFVAAMSERGSNSRKEGTTTRE